MVKFFELAKLSVPVVCAAGAVSHMMQKTIEEELKNAGPGATVKNVFVRGGDRLFFLPVVVPSKKPAPEAEASPAP